MCVPIAATPPTLDITIHKIKDNNLVNKLRLKKTCVQFKMMVVVMMLITIIIHFIFIAVQKTETLYHGIKIIQSVHTIITTNTT